MTTIPGTTRTQTIFLRAFRTSPTGPAPENWPSPSILRRWLRSPGFRAALNSLQKALRFQADFQLAASATHAIKNLSTAAAPLSVIDVNRLLRISHLRQRFTPEDITPQTQANKDEEEPAEEEDDDPKVLRCPACRRRAQDPYWIGDPKIFAEAAFRAGYSSPLQHSLDFPEPVPQDTFYYKLLQDPAALLWYMYQYDRTFNDHRFQPIMIHCHRLMPYLDESYPRFHDTPPLPESSERAR